MGVFAMYPIGSVPSHRLLVNDSKSSSVVIPHSTMSRYTGRRVCIYFTFSQLHWNDCVFYSVRYERDNLAQAMRAMINTYGTYVQHSTKVIYTGGYLDTMMYHSIVYPIHTSSFDRIIDCKYRTKLVLLKNTKIFWKFNRCSKVCWFDIDSWQRSSGSQSH